MCVWQTPKYLPLEAPKSAGTSFIINRMWQEYIEYTRKKASALSNAFFFFKHPLYVVAPWCECLCHMRSLLALFRLRVSSAAARARFDCNAARWTQGRCCDLTLVCVAPSSRTWQGVDRQDGRLSQKDFGQLVKWLGMDNLTDKNGQ